MDRQTDLLRQFVELCKSDPSLLHEPRFAFYREYLESLGASIPPRKDVPPTKDVPQSPPKDEEAEKPMSESSEDEELPELIPLDLDMSGVIESDHDEPLPMGDSTREVNDDDIEKGNEERDSAMTEFAEGNYEKAVEHFTKAIELNPGSSILHAKRANALLKLNKPNAAIRDCAEAISLNPDSAQGYKFRGRAYRLLGKFLEAHRDFAMACKLDYDETVNEWMKEVESNAKKILARNREVERLEEQQRLKKREKDLKKRKKEHEKAAEANKKQFEMPREFSPGGLSDLLKDPEIAEMLQDQEVIQAYMDIMQKPENLMKYMNNPRVMKAMEKFGNLEKIFNIAQGATGSTEENSKGTSESKETPSFTKVPEPDLD